MKSASLMLVTSLLVAAGCDKSTTTKAGQQGGGKATPAAGYDPTWSAKTVGAPIAGDLDTYTKAIPGTGDLLAAIETPLGTIHCKFLPDVAPLTVANFIGLATGQKAWKSPTGEVVAGKPFFDGLIFHRVISGFMIQGGDPEGTGGGGPGYQFVNETSPQVKMEPGTLAMANAGKNTNGSQFFITDGSPESLNGGYSIFGRCKETEIVKAIEALGGPNDRPTTEVAMKVTISKGTY